MGWLSKWWHRITGFAGDVVDIAFKYVVNPVINAVIDVGSGLINFAEATIKSIGVTVQNIIRDPIPTILTIGGSMVGIPPYVTAAAVTATRGGKLEDIAKSAAVSYAGTTAMSAIGSTQLGADIKNAIVTNPIADFTDTVMTQFNLTPDQSVAVSKAATSALNSSIVGGVRAVLTGQNVTAGITSGFTSGLVYSSTDSYFDSLNQDQNWGLSPTALNLLKGAASTGLQSAITGKGDPAQAIGNYIAYASLKVAGTDLANSAKAAFNEMTGLSTIAQQKQNDYTAAQTEYSNRVSQFNTLQASVQADVNDFNTKLDEVKLTQAYKDIYVSSQPATDFELSWGLIDYWNPPRSLQAQQAAVYGHYNDYIARDLKQVADSMVFQINYINNKIAETYNQIAPALNELETKDDAITKNTTLLNEIKKTIEVPDGSNIAQILKDTSVAYQTAVDNFNAAKTVADTAAVNVDKSLSDVVTRDATIDLLNTGAIKITGTNADGSYALSNGMYLSNGKFFQDGQQLFANAAGIDQGAINVADSNGNMISFDASAGSVMSTTDIKTRIKNEYGVDVSDETANSLAGKTWDKVDKSVVDSAVHQIKTTTVTGSLKDFLAYNADKPNTGVFKEPDGSYSVMALDRAMKFTDNGDLISQFTTGGGDRSDHPSASAVSAAVSKDMTDTTERATGMWGQLMATGAQGAGELLQNYATAISLSTGLDMQSSLYRAGKAMEDWGKNKDSTDVKNQTDAINAAVTNAGKNSNFLEQVQIIGRALKDNPLGFASFIGKEVTQDGPGLALGFAVAAGVSALGGAGLAAGAAALGVATAFEAIETLGSSGKAVYDNLIKSGATPEEARDKALVAGAMNAAMNAPIDAITNKMIFTRYLGGITDGIKGIAAKYGSATLTGSLAEFLQTVPQALVEDKFSGKVVDIKNALAQGIFSAAIGSGSSSSHVATNDAAVVAKDFLGNNVTFGELKSGVKLADLSTLNPNAVIGTNANGSQMTMSGLTQSSDIWSIAGDTMDSVLPQSLTSDDSIISISSAGIPITLGEAQSKIDSLFAGFNLNQTKIDALSPLILKEFVNGNSGDTLANDVSTILTNAGLEAQQVYDATKSFVPTWTAVAPNEAMAKTAGFPSYAAYQQYGGDINAYNTAQTSAANLATAKAAGFPDYANYTLYNGDINAFNTANANTANTKTATDAGFPDFATYTQYAGDVAAYNTVKTNTANTKTATDAGFPDFATYTQYNGDVSAYNTATTTAANTKKATDAGFPDYATYTQYNGNKAVYTAALSDASNTALATKAGFPDFNTYTLYGGNKNAYDTALTNTANTQKATAAGFPNYAAYTQYNGDVNAYNADSAAKIAGWKDAAEQTKANTAGYTEPAAYATYLTNTANTQKATTAGFPDYGTYTQFNGDLAAYNSSKLTAETTKAINNAIAGIQFPAGITAADVAAQVKAALAANPNLTVADVTGSIVAYMTANPQLTTADINTAISTATANLASKTDVSTAVQTAKDALTKSINDLATGTSTSFDAVNTAIANLKVAGLTETQVNDLITASAANQNTAFKTALTEAQAGNTTAINTLSTSIAGVRTSLTTAIDAAIASGLAGDAALQAAIAQVASDNQTTSANILSTLGTTSDQLKTDFSTRLSNVQTQTTADITALGNRVNTRIDELVRQGVTQQAATTQAIGELGTNITDVQRTLLEKIASDKALADKAAADKAAADAKTAADAKAARTAQSAQVGYSMVSPSAAQLAEPAPKMPEFKSPFMSSPIMQQAAFAGPLAGFLSQVKKDQYTENPYAPKNSIAGEAPQPQERPMQQQQEPSSYFNYGQDSNIDQILNPGAVEDPMYKTALLTAKKGGLATPLMAGGGTTRYGKYAGGGLNVVNHSGKDRVDFRTGDAVTGPGDGQSDDIPAMLADGEFVFPADVVAALGNGSTKAGSDKLYDMMHSIRSHTRSAKPQDLPPAAKSPLDYLKTSRKARR